MFMKVITIKEPFASLIRAGIKEYEFRTWKTNYRGEILIHASLGVDKLAMEKYKSYNLDYHSGCIIAKATITDCIKIDNEARNMLKEKNPLVYGNIINNTNWEGYGFKLENIEIIEPIKVKGKLGLWDYEMKW